MLIPKNWEIWPKNLENVDGHKFQALSSMPISTESVPLFSLPQNSVHRAQTSVPLGTDCRTRVVNSLKKSKQNDLFAVSCFAATVAIPQASNNLQECPLLHGVNRSESDPGKTSTAL